MKKGLFFASLILLVSTAVGCSGGASSDDGIPAADKAAAADAHQIAVSVNGDYDKLTPDQKKQFITLAGGEGQARKMVNFMAHPPVNGPGQGPAAGGPGSIPTGPHHPGAG
jgi:hypothetical protein